MKHTAIVATADKPNQNNHIYPKAVLKSIIEHYESFPNYTFLGMRGMSDSIIRFSQASHFITGLYMDGSDLVAEIETIDNDNGKALEQMLIDGVAAFRLQGIGIVQEQDGYLIIQNGYKMITINAVHVDIAA